MKVAYETLSEAINALKQEGFTYDYNLQDKGILNSQKKSHIPASDLTVVCVYRFEGNTNPDDNAILYAIELPEVKRDCFWMPMVYMLVKFLGKCLIS